MIVGYVRSEKDKLFNSAALCEKGKIIDSYDKILLPTYDVFDEHRYFTPGLKPVVWPINVDGKIINLGIQICEDLWDLNYSTKVTKEQKKNGADLIINISASPYSKHILNDRVNLIQTKAKESGVPILYCNLVGAQDELVFDGCSIGFNESGERIGQAKSFKDDILIIDFDNKNYAGDIDYWF